MNPLYFGPSQNPLYGVFHPASSQSARAPAILLCNPFGVEAIRAFRIYRILAEKMARAGSPVLRFDYYGTGESSGECHEFSVTTGVRDILSAHQELMDMTGATRVVWIGLRLGAMLSVLASQDRPKGLAGAVLWEPVMDGRDYLDELRDSHISGLATVFDQSEAFVLSKRKNVEFSKEALGFVLGEKFRTEMQSTILDDVCIRPGRSVTILTRDDTSKLLPILEATGARVTLYRDEETKDWNSDAAMNAFAVPTKTIDTIVETIGGMR